MKNKSDIKNNTTEHRKALYTKQEAQNRAKKFGVATLATLITAGGLYSLNKESQNSDCEPTEAVVHPGDTMWDLNGSQAKLSDESVALTKERDPNFDPSNMQPGDQVVICLPNEPGSPEMTIDVPPEQKNAG